MYFSKHQNKSYTDISTFFNLQVDADDDVIMMIQKHIVSDYQDQKVSALNIVYLVKSAF